MDRSGFKVSSLPWVWTIEYLAKYKQVKPSFLHAVIEAAPDIPDDIGKNMREAVSLRCLEELSSSLNGYLDGMSCGDSRTKINSSESCEDILQHLLHDVNLVASLSEVALSGKELLKWDIHLFTEQKKGSMPRTALEELKDTIVNGRHPHASSLRDLSGLTQVNIHDKISRDNDVDYVPDTGQPNETETAGHNAVSHGDSLQEGESHVVKRGLRDPTIDNTSQNLPVIHNTGGSDVNHSKSKRLKQNGSSHLQSEKEAPVTSPERPRVPAEREAVNSTIEQIEAFNEQSAREECNGNPIKHGCDEPIHDKISCNDGVDYVPDTCEPNEIENADHNAVSRGESLQEGGSHVVKRGLRDPTIDNTVQNLPVIHNTGGSDVNHSKSKRLKRNGSSHMQSEKEAPVTSPERLHVPAEREAVNSTFEQIEAFNGQSAREDCNDEPIPNGNESHHKVYNDAFMSQPVCEILEGSKDASAGKVQMRETIAEDAECRTECCTEEISGDTDGYQTEPIDVTPKKHEFLNNKCTSDHNPLSMVDWTKQNVCMKCNKGGRLLVCQTTNCPLVVHENCVDPLSSFDDDGKFFCPFCGYSKSISQYLEAKKMVSLARKDLAEFMDMIAKHQLESLYSKGYNCPGNVENMPVKLCQDDVVPDKGGNREMQKNQGQKEEVVGASGGVVERQKGQALDNHRDEGAKLSHKNPVGVMRNQNVDGIDGGQEVLPSNKNKNAAVLSEKPVSPNSHGVDTSEDEDIESNVCNYRISFRT